MKIEMIQPRLPTEQEIESEIKRLRDKARYRNALAGTIRILIFLSVILIICKIVIMSAELFMLHQQQVHVNVMPILSCRLVIWGLLLIILYVAVSGMMTINKMIQKTASSKCRRASIVTCKSTSICPKRRGVTFAAKF